MAKIYVVEDDDNIRSMLVYALNSSSFETEDFSSSVSLYESLDKEIPSLILLDIMLPGDDGLTILKTLKEKEKYSEIPIILLTAKSSEYDKLIGLDTGADDYITKPFSVLEVISRIKAVLRRYKKEEKEKDEISFENLILNSEKREVLVDGEEVVLTYKEFELLSYLLRHRDIVLSRERILDRVWGYDYIGETRTVDMHIKTLRAKLKSAGDIIKTVRNVGYKI